MMKPADTLSRLPRKPLEETDVGVIAERLGQLGTQTADCAVILGSGLSGFVHKLAHRKHLPYHLVDGLPETGVCGHPGEVVSGTLGRRRILAWAGRFHAYAGYSHAVQTLPVRISHALGIRHLLVTNAAGGIHERLSTGDIMLIDDIIDFSSLHHTYSHAHPRSQVFGRVAPASCQENEHVNSPLVSNRQKQDVLTQKQDVQPEMHDMPAQKQGLPPEMHNMLPFARFSGHENNRLASKMACKHGISTERGCYMFVPGPCYETPAETKAYRLLGADAVGMSTTAELREAARLGMNAAGISLIANAAATIGSEPPCHSDVLRTARTYADRLERLLTLLVTDAESPFYNSRSEPL